MYQNSYRKQEYRQQDVMGASPLRLVIMAYDYAIRACEQKDFEKSTRAISVLRDALNFDYAEVSEGLFKLYQWCLDCIRQGDFAQAAGVLRELRSAWNETEQRMGAPVRPIATVQPVYGGSLGVSA